MSPVTRRSSFPKVLIERDSDSEQSSSEEELEEEEILHHEQNGFTENEKTQKLELGFDVNRKGKTPITIALKKVCKVTLFFFFNVILKDIFFKSVIFIILKSLIRDI